MDAITAAVLFVLCVLACGIEIGAVLVRGRQ